MSYQDYEDLEDGEIIECPKCHYKLLAPYVYPPNPHMLFYLQEYWNCECYMCGFIFPYQFFEFED